MKIKWDDQPLPLPPHPMSLAECLARYGHSVPEGHLELMKEVIEDNKDDDDDQ